MITRLLVGLVILTLSAIETIETGLRWLYCETVFSWVARWQLERLFPKKGGWL
jgi:hypothetical protein